MFSVIEVKTTGLRPGGRDRVIDLAIVRLGADHEVVDEWSTLSDPGCPVRGARIHGIYTRHVEDAPAFADIAGDLAERLAVRSRFRAARSGTRISRVERLNPRGGPLRLRVVPGIRKCRLRVVRRVREEPLWTSGPRYAASL